MTIAKLYVPFILSPQQADYLQSNHVSSMIGMLNGASGTLAEINSESFKFELPLCKSSLNIHNALHLSALHLNNLERECSPSYLLRTHFL